MDYEIHPMSMDDYAQVLGLWEATEGIGLTESDSRECMARYLERNAGLSLVVRTGAGELVGAVLCGHDGARGYLRHLAVAKDHRGRGLGKMLVEEGLSRLKSAGIPKCTIFLYAHNQEGQHFWHHVGWRRRDDLLVMQAVLSRSNADQEER